MLRIHTLDSKRAAVASALPSDGRFHSRFSMVMGRGVSGATTMRRAYRLRSSSEMPARSQSMASPWLLLCKCGRLCRKSYGLHVLHCCCARHKLGITNARPTLGKLHLTVWDSKISSGQEDLCCKLHNNTHNTNFGEVPLRMIV